MSGYLRPVEAPISCSRQCHADRNPPSSEPGTDYACAYGTPIQAAEAGTVVDLSHSNGGGTGRFLTIDLDDGRRVRYLHLSEVWLGGGARVGRGSVVGLSGASGWGSDWGYGAHVHTTLWDFHGYDFDGNTLDFELYVGDPTPPPNPLEKEDVMIRIQSTNRGIAMIGSGWYTPLYTSAEVAASDQLITKHITTDDATWDLLKTIALNGNSSQPASLGAYPADWPKPYVPPATTPPVDPCPDKSSTLTAAAWFGGAVLALIGIVDAVRLILDTVT